MKYKKLLLLFCIPVIACLNNCTQESQDVADLQELKTTIDEFYKAVNEGDTEKRLSLFTQDAKILPNHGKLFILDDSSRAVWKSYDDEWVFRIEDLDDSEITMSGDLAYTVNTYFYTFHHKTSEPVWHETKNVHIWKKQADNTWKLHIDIWNSSVPPAQ